MAAYQRELSLFTPDSSSFPSSRRFSKSFPTNRWKENLRLACLENARRRRRDVVMRKRGQPSPSATNDSELSAKSVVMEQCQKYGIGLTSCDSSFPSATASSVTVEGRELTDHGCAMDVEPENKLLDVGDSTLTEGDVFEILREVEEELRVDDDFLVEEILEAEKCTLQCQINDYETWHDAMDPESCVPCPICKTSFLCVSVAQEVGCSDEHCPLRIRPRNVEQPLLLLKNELGTLYESHSSTCCNDLVFDVSSSTNGFDLLASCQSCKLFRKFE